MIHIDGPEIKLEGNFSGLLKEISRALHAIATAMVKEIDDPEFEYDHAIEYVLNEIDMLKEFVGSNEALLPKDVLKAFFKKLEKYRIEKGDSPSWVEYSAGKEFNPNKKTTMKSMMKNFSIDPRTEDSLDINDLKAIKKAKKKKKK
jgi:hypothetical protein